MKRFVALWVLVYAVLSPALVGAEETKRIVTITILLDRDNNTKEALLCMENAIYSAVQKFKEEFGIQLKVKNLQNWIPSSDNFDADKELARLISYGHASDIVIAFTNKSFFRNEAMDVDGEAVTMEKQLGGLAMVLGNHAIVSLEEKSDLFLIHEVAHLLGANHSPDPDSVMNGNGVVTPNFDKKSKEAITANLGRKF